MNYEELKNLVLAGESYHTEFKRTLDKSFIEEACAFANSGGGRILLGVTDQGDIRGISTDNRMRSQVQDSLRQLEPKLDCQVRTVENIIEVNVPEGVEKPYGCSKGFFMRMGANTQKLSRNEIIDFYQKEGRIRFAELRHPTADFAEDFDLHAFDHFIQLSGISQTIDRNILLRNLNCLTRDGQLTNAGVLFFGKDIDFLLNHAVVVCALYHGDEKVNILDRKDFRTNLLDNIDNALLFVQRHTNVAYKIESTRHEEVPDYPEIALREAIINAVCHRDYFEKGAQVMVEVFANRVEITNPGGLPTNLKPEEFGTKSVTRNPLIASLLHRADYIERMGTGISRMQRAVDRHGGCTIEFVHTAFYTTIFRKKSEGNFSLRLESRPESRPELRPESELANRVLLLLYKASLGKSELARELGHKSVSGELNKQVKNLLSADLIEMTIPDKPNSRLQKYRLTITGKHILDTNK